MTPSDGEGVVKETRQLLMLEGGGCDKINLSVMTKTTLYYHK